MSGAAAKAIKNKFVALFDAPDAKDDQTKTTSPFPTPSQVFASDLARLRTAGLSGRKAEYIHGLAEKFVHGHLGADMLVRASDDEVLEKLTAVRGLGRWSVEMFACFCLKRMDVFSTGDLGVQYVPRSFPLRPPLARRQWGSRRDGTLNIDHRRGLAAYLGKDVNRLKAKGGGKWKYLSEREMLDASAKFAPYRSVLYFIAFLPVLVPRTRVSSSSILPVCGSHFGMWSVVDEVGLMAFNSSNQESFYVVHVADRRCQRRRHSESIMTLTSSMMIDMGDKHARAWLRYSGDLVSAILPQ